MATKFYRAAMPSEDENLFQLYKGLLCPVKIKTYFNCIKGCSSETKCSVVTIQYICSPTEELGRERGSTAVL
jgi:hypothetical protein